MAFQATIKVLQQLFSDMYGLYLKTQNYHWHVVGPNFKLIHELFEGQYKELGEHIDSIAERIVTLGGKAPADFKAIAQATTISSGDSAQNWQKMVTDLAADQNKIVERVQEALKTASKEGDEGTAAMLSEYITHYQKNHWFLENHLK